MKKRNFKVIKLVMVALVLTMNLVVFATPVKAYSPSEKPKPTMIDKIISPFIYGFAWTIDTMFFTSIDGTPKGTSIDALVYNTGQSAVGILDGKGGSNLQQLRDFILKYYLVFEYLAVTMFIPLGLWIGIYFTRAGDNAQHKLVLKDKIFKLFITIMLLNSMPTIITMLFKINDALVVVFKAIGMDAISGGATTSDSGFLLKSFKEQAISDGTIITAFAYLASTFLNIWLLFYYFIRDITIAFLFVIFPIFAILTPLEDSPIKVWFKEITSNIFSQAIQSGVLVLVLAMAKFLPTTFINLCYTITAFAFVIPMTGIIKRILGIEGNIGAGKSMAGLGAMFGAMQVGRMAYGTLKNTHSNYSNARAKLDELNTQEQELSKTGKIGELTRNDLGKELQPTSKATLTLDDIKNQKAQVKRDMIKNGLATVGGAYVGGMSALGGISMGAGGSALAGGIGTVAGSSIGKGIGDNIAIAGNLIAHEIDENRQLNEGISDGTSTYAENIAKYTGIDSPVLKDAGIQEKLQNAELKKRRYMAMGMPNKARSEYAKSLPQFSTDEEIAKLDNAKLYQDKGMSALYSIDNEGNTKVHRIGAGDSSLLEPIVRNVSMEDGSLEINDNRLNEMWGVAEDRAYSLAGLDRNSISSKEAEKNKLFTTARAEEYKKLQKEELTSIQASRSALGVDNLHFVGGAEKYHQGNHVLRNEELEQFKKFDDNSMTKINMSQYDFDTSPVNPIPTSGYGFVETTQNGSILVEVDGNDPTNAKPISFGVGNAELGLKDRQYAPVKFTPDGVMMGQLQNALKGNTFDKGKYTNFEMDKVQGFMASNPNALKPNEEYVITVNQGNYNYYEQNTGKMVGYSPVPQAYSGQDTQNITYHVQVDSSGKGIRQYDRTENMSVSDMNNIYHAGVDTRLQEVQRNQINTTIAQLKQQIAGFDYTNGSQSITSTIN